MSDRITTALRTDTGKVRQGNEDALAEDAARGLLVLADGMGGHAAGEVASQIAVRVVLENVGQAAATHPASQLLRSAFTAANAAIHDAARAKPEYKGMGTTAVASLLREDRLTIAHVGDSRVYRLRAGMLTALTRDHSLLEELVARGHYSRDEAARSGRGSILVRALGVEPTIEIDIIEEHVEPGDILLLCSDGLSDMVDHTSIERILVESGADVAATAALLIETANLRGGRDNISVALARVEPSSSSPKTWWGRLTGR